MGSNIIGIGERITGRLLAKLYPETILARQVKMTELLSKDFIEDMGQRARKETVDLVVFRPKPLVIRVQDDHHKTSNFAIIDGRQKWELEASGCDVVDIWKSDCPAIFKEKNILLAEKELKVILADYL